MTLDTAQSALFRLSGDQGLLLELGQSIDLETNARARTLADRLEHKPLPGLIEVIPAYCSVLIIYDPGQTDLEDLKQAVLEHTDQASLTDAPP